MQCDPELIIEPLSLIKFTAFERRRVLRVCKEFSAQTRYARKLREKICPALLHKRGQLFVVI